MFNRDPVGVEPPRSNERPTSSDASIDHMSTSLAPTAKLQACDDGVVIIGKGTRVIGQIQDCSVLDVHGVLEADVVADSLVVRDGGGVQGNIRTNHAEVRGVVEGHLSVLGHLNIESTGLISGDVSYNSIAAAAGGKIQGNIHVHEPEPEVDLEEQPFVDPTSGKIIEIASFEPAEEFDSTVHNIRAS